MAKQIGRVVVWFSAGVTSAIAAKIAADTYGGRLPVHLVNCDTGSEHEDNLRFMHDVSAWLGIPLEIIRNERYTDTFSVYDETGFFKNEYGAKCTVELKKVPRRRYENLATDLQVFGFDADEEGRAATFSENNPEVRVWYPLVQRGITKSMARQILFDAGIAEPITYAMGFRNANCLKRGCVKGGMGYWNHIRRVLPEVFANMAAKEREIGYALLTKDVLAPNGVRTKTPIFLDELPVNAGNYNAEPAFQCSLFCSPPTP